jgi:hypothetical protein
MHDADILHRENRYTLAVVEALFGLISEDIYAIVLRIDWNEPRLTLLIWVSEATAAVQDDAEEMLFSLDALLQPEDIAMDSDIIVGKPPATPDGLFGRGRPVYIAKRRS